MIMTGRRALAGSSKMVRWSLTRPPSPCLLRIGRIRLPFVPGAGIVGYVGKSRELEREQANRGRYAGVAIRDYRALGREPSTRVERSDLIRRSPRAELSFESFGRGNVHRSG